MEQSTIATVGEKGSWKSIWHSVKKTVLTTIVSVIITAALMLVPFYYNTENTSKDNTAKIEKNIKDIEELKKSAIETKVNVVQISDLQKQLEKVDSKVLMMDSKITTYELKNEQRFQQLDSKSDKIYDILIKQKNK